jgi:hypothetical protein
MFVPKLIRNFINRTLDRANPAVTLPILISLFAVVTLMAM